MKTLTRTTEQRSASTTLANVFYATTFYSYGTAMMDYFLIYPSRAIVGELEFVAYHALLDDRILPISVIPFSVLTVMNILLLRFRPVGIPKGLIWASLICLLIDWVSTAFVQIPMNLQLNEGKDLALIRRVMDTNWVRVFLESAQAVLAFMMMQKSK